MCMYIFAGVYERECGADVPEFVMWSTQTVPAGAIARGDQKVLTTKQWRKEIAKNSSQ